MVLMLPVSLLLFMLLFLHSVQCLSILYLWTHLPYPMLLLLFRRPGHSIQRHSLSFGSSHLLALLPLYSFEYRIFAFMPRDRLLLLLLHFFQHHQGSFN
jgi:hypothetical protein